MDDIFLVMHNQLLSLFFMFSTKTKKSHRCMMQIFNAKIKFKLCLNFKHMDIKMLNDNKMKKIKAPS